MRILILILTLCLSLSTAVTAGADSRTDNPRELGRISWQKNVDKALKEAETTGKPVLVLFQEIPG